MSGRFLEISDRLAARAETYHRRKLRENASFRNPAVSNISRGSVSHYGYPSHYHTESHHDQKQDDPYMSMDNFTNCSCGWKFHFYGIICHVPTKGRYYDFNEQLGHFFSVAIFFLCACVSHSFKVLIISFSMASYYRLMRKKPDSTMNLVILWPFQSFFLQVTYISFTKLRFRRSFWGA